MIKINVIGKECPIPLNEFRKALRKAKVGEIIEIVGTHELSKGEIALAADETGQEILEIDEKDGVWRIVVKKVR
ncbi:sulfurtransferase TusA family protein [Thermococcus sp. M39]|uniref:sulfurtransferase TusA family protein n=1 Tax=unclassified Thermococcus TaxID=2627626 RepID=UPI00143C2701|nr:MULTISPECIES: sulfurtransferase TusA family protein [unclassified Thermococcus]MBO8174881.1 sulfurtransferase TusA family protein [Thermococcus sp.]NJE07740.1 sulfurtransferase TusA family protein [Thermococcus sp. M39]NJE12296.1 sulfurtransferase TusA family protein [Thermococcus sp. LS2]WRS53012.1 sulfurtransferase TusA family protein [Thermococcus sp. SY098]